MKLSVNFDALWGNVDQMGAKKVTLDIGNVWRPELDPIDDDLEKGRETKPDEIEVHNGVLSVRGRQVVLYIPDHGIRVLEALDDGGTGKKFHIAQCRTLDEMKQKKRFERYFAKNNLSEQFHIHGHNEDNHPVEGYASLNVCKNCLKYLNYKGSATAKKMGLNQIVAEFNMGEFFSTYSSVFRHMPKEMKVTHTKGYTGDWPTISAKARENAGHTCSECSVNLDENRHLLHTHHINGVKHDNSQQNLQVLCADCHRKQPLHDHMFVKHEDMQTINRLRREQRLIGENAPGWKTAFDYVDSALWGVLDLAQKRGGYGPPEIGYKLTDEKGRVITELEVAWPESKFGVAINNSKAVDGWYLIGLKEALDFFSKPPQR